jgi:hypothetical protein
MFDLEGMPPHLDEFDKIYLWGMQVFGKIQGKFMPAISGFGDDGDHEGWKQFLTNAQSIFQQFGDIPFIHWHHYEKTHLDDYVERYGDPEGIAARVRRNLLDLLPIARDSVLLPLSSYSLKEVEKYVGFIVTNLVRPAKRVVRFYNQRGTAEQWIKEGKNAVKWTRLSCHDFVDNQVRLQLFVLAYNLGNFLRQAVLPKAVRHWTLTTLREKLIKIGAKVVRHSRKIVFQMAEVAVPRELFRAILEGIERLRLPAAATG